MMSRRRQIYEGKAKVLFEGPEPGTLVQYFKDDASAFNNQKRGTITGKGVLNNRISEYLMSRLAEIGIPTHFVRRLNMREQLVREVEIIPIGVVVRNIAAGSLSERLGIASSWEIHRSIKVTQKTAWFMLHRIRLALQDAAGGKIGGPDGTFISGV